MAAKGNVLQSPECITVSKLQVNLLGDIQAVQIAAGENAVNNLVFISSKGITEYDDATREERGTVTTDGINELDAVTNNSVVVTNDDGYTTSYYVKQGQTIVSVGNSSIVNINIDDKKLLKKLAEIGEFKVISGQDLVSVIWSCDRHQNSQTITELKVSFLPKNDTQSTSEMEQEIFQELRSEENQKLKKLITKLISVFNAKLKHIRIGCLQFVLTTESLDEAQHLVRKKAELTEIFTSTLIPSISEIEINILPDRSKADSSQSDVVDLPYQSIPDDSFPDAFSIASDHSTPDSSQSDIRELSGPGSLDSIEYTSLKSIDMPGPSTASSSLACDCCKLYRSKSRCYECGKTLCLSCTTAHDVFLPNNNHTIVNYPETSDIQTSTDAKLLLEGKTYDLSTVYNINNVKSSQEILYIGHNAPWEIGVCFHDYYMYYNIKLANDYISYIEKNNIETIYI